MYQPWVDRMNQAQSARERSAIAKELATLRGWSQDKTYRTLKDAGWESGRRRRVDAGSSGQDQATLMRVAALIREGVRENGKAVMPVNVARSILEANGVEMAVGDSQLRALLRRARLDVKSQMVASPAQRMRSEGPNHVHFVDPSLALLYYGPDGRQHLIHQKLEAYKNKPFLEGKEHLKLWRYVLTDHYSSSICVRYYQAAGENSVNLWDFLLYAWGAKADPLYAIHGLPDLLIMDAGSANISKAITRALAGLRVDARAHLPGNPRAKGQVEKLNHLVELYLESRMRAEPVTSASEINALAERFAAAFNSNTIPGLDTRLHRSRTIVGARLALWQRIKAEELRELPDAETCRLLLSTEPIARKLDNHLSVTYAHPKIGRSAVYSLAHLPGLVVGDSVEVQPILYGDDPALLVHYLLAGERTQAEVLPIELDEAGFDVSAAVFGVNYKRAKETVVEKNDKALSVLAYGKPDAKRGERPFASANGGAGLVAHSFIGAAEVDIKPARKTGTAVEVAEVVRAHEIAIPVAEAAKRVKARSGGWLPSGYLDRLKKDYPNGVPSDEVEALAAELTQAGGSGALPHVKEA